MLKEFNLENDLKKFYEINLKQLENAIYNITEQIRKNGVIE